MRSLFVGLSGPIGYDYWRGGQRPEQAVTPNAVLEDVTGLLLCYDRLVFLCRDVCPEDMWDLPYVSFVSDDMTNLDRALEAYYQYDELIRTHGSLGWGDIRGVFVDRIKRMTSGQGSGGIDNHSRQFDDLSQIPRPGNSAHADSAIIDVGIASALDLSDVDVLTNSVASAVVNQKLDLLDHDQTFSSWHIEVASSVATITVPNTLGPRGGYHDEIEDYRSDPQVKEFRKFLAEERADGQEAAEAAREITELATAYARRLELTRRDKRPIYQTVGRALIAPLGNALIPGFGSGAKGALTALEAAEERRMQKRTAWAAFILRAQERAYQDG